MRGRRRMERVGEFGRPGGGVPGATSDQRGPATLMVTMSMSWYFWWRTEEA